MSFNVCIFTGRTTNDIELRYSQNNVAVGAFSLAVDTGYGENKKTSFFNCTAFKGTAESMEKYVKKGTKIVLQAEAVQDSYTDNHGVKRNTVNFIVRNWEFAESKASSNSEPQENKAEQIPPKQTSSDDFMNIPDGLAEELPFN